MREKEKVERTHDSIPWKTFKEECKPKELSGLLGTDDKSFPVKSVGR